MASFILKNEGYPYKIIYQSRKKVGRVFRHAEGHYVGMIGKDERRGATEREAFDEVCAAAFGFDSSADLREANSRTRHANKVRRQIAHRAVDRMLGGDFSALDALFRSVK